jgi:hypothetical protein
MNMQRQVTTPLGSCLSRLSQPWAKNDPACVKKITPVAMKYLKTGLRFSADAAINRK